MTGKTISHYKILEKLGEGGMGVVYKAQDFKLDRFVALKFLPQHLSQAEEEKKRFIHEAKAASALDHPNICTIYEIDETEDEQMFIAMACYEGESLKVIIDRGPFPIDEAIDIAIQIAQGLAKAHSKDIVHRDIKPANVLITEDSQVKIVDFGLAKLVGRTMLTEEGTTLGTASYMSPEQTQGTEVDHRTDIWALGVVLYEMLTGRQPFEGDYEQAVMYSIMNEDVGPVTGLRTGVPMELERIINKALTKSPDERYQHVDEMIVDMRSVGKEMELSGKSTAGTSAPPKSVKPKKLGKMVIAPTAVLLVTIAILIFGPFFEEQPLVSSPRPVVVMPFENQTGDAGLDYLRAAIPNLLITNLEQSKYLNVVTWERMQDLLRIMGRDSLQVLGMDRETGFELCKLEGVHGIVLGSFTRAGDVFATDIKVLEVGSKKMLRSANSHGSGVGSVIERQIDELTENIWQVVAALPEAAEKEEFRIAEVTTSSLEAYRHYLAGVKDYHEILWSPARVSLEKAIGLDSTFAMAYYYLARTNRQLGNMKGVRVAFEKAMTYSMRATAKEALFIKMDYASFVQNDAAKATILNEKLVERFPKEKTAHFYLARKYLGGRRYHEAIASYNRIVELDPNWAASYNGLGYNYAAIGELEKAVENLEKYAALSPNKPNAFDSLGEIYMLMGRLDDAILNFKKTLEIDPAWIGGPSRLAYVYALKEDYAEALRYVEEVFSLVDKFVSTEQEPIYRSWALRNQADYYFYLGRYREALKLRQELSILMRSAGAALNAAESLEAMAFVYAESGNFNEAESRLQESLRLRLSDSPQDSLRWQMAHQCISGFFDIKVGKAESARKKLTRVKELFPKVEHPALEIYAYWIALLEGEVALAENHTGQAIELFGQSTPPAIYHTIYGLDMNLYRTPIPRDGLARVYTAAGDLDKAIIEYRKLTTIAESRALLIDPKYHYHLGKLYEDKGWLGLALQEYEKFLEIWKDADEDLPNLIDAKARLTKVKEM
ncbi:MAG: protein kinase [bacterium]